MCLKCNMMPLGGNTAQANYSVNSTELDYAAVETDPGILTDLMFSLLMFY